MLIYSIFDKKVLEFSPLFLSENDEAAKRVVILSLSKDNIVASFPSDYALYCIGEFNSSDGTISGLSPVKLVCEILSLIKVDKNGES